MSTFNKNTNFEVTQRCLNYLDRQVGPTSDRSWIEDQMEPYTSKKFQRYIKIGFLETLDPRHGFGPTNMDHFLSDGVEEDSHDDEPIGNHWKPPIQGLLDQGYIRIFEGEAPPYMSFGIRSLGERFESRKDGPSGFSRN